ncbi:hypothetical protein WAI453_000879 [Rhynchosporium graminicola]
MDLTLWSASKLHEIDLHGLFLLIWYPAHWSSVKAESGIREVRIHNFLRMTRTSFHMHSAAGHLVLRLLRLCNSAIAICTSPTYSKY